MTCAIAGGGPAGMMLGVLLARAGVNVCVLEKHADFLRDFRGDTVHPSTLEVMHELGILESFLERPHQKVERLQGQIGDTPVTIADFSHLPTTCPFIAFVPQWDFLDFLSSYGRGFDGFRLEMKAEAIGLLEADGRVEGLRVRTPSGEHELRAALTIGADGRSSIVRERAGLEVRELGAPIDVLWMRMPKAAGDQRAAALGRIVAGRIFIMLDRGDYWQCGFVIAKGAFDDIRARGLGAFHDEIRRAAPSLGDRADAIADWDEVKLLTVKVDRLRRWWRDGLLCIGDSAHAMSPIGGVGINLAIQDAVAAANLLADPLRRGRATTADLERVQRRREWPTRVTQALQVFLQNRVIRRVLELDPAADVGVPFPVKLLQRWPVLQRVPARLVGLGARPEHVETLSVL